MRGAKGGAVCSVDPGWQIRNPKSETRNKSEIRRPKAQNRAKLGGFWISALRSEPRVEPFVRLIQAGKSETRNPRPETNPKFEGQRLKTEPSSAGFGFQPLDRSQGWSRLFG